MRHIEIVKCATCGKEVEGRIHNAKYCSKRCANLRANARKSRTNTFQCPHNHEVTCTVQKCRACGWNPDVAQRRMEKLMGRA